MKKVWKVLSIIFDILLVAALIVGLFFLAKWVGGHHMWSVQDIFGGM
jgi:hypothetical protein